MTVKFEWEHPPTDGFERHTTVVLFDPDPQNLWGAVKNIAGMLDAIPMGETECSLEDCPGVGLEDESDLDVLWSPTTGLQHYNDPTGATVPLVIADRVRDETLIAVARSLNWEGM